MVALSKRPELLEFVKKRARETKAIWCVMQARNGQLVYALAETAVRQTLENPPHTYTYKILDVVYPSGQVEPFDPRYLNWAFQKWAFKHRIQELVDEFIRERESTKDGVEYWDKFLDLDGRQAADEFAIFILGNNRTN